MPGLQDVRVIDLSQVLAGPYCTMLLGDLGCDVVKVEHPRSGDSTRGEAGDTWQAAGFYAVNRNKRSITLDLHHPEAVAALKRLVAGADVFVESFRPGTAERFGISYAELGELNPGLVYASISGYGATGPLSDMGGYDIMAQALSGIMSVTGEEDGPPLKSGVPVTDVGAGLYCLAGILAALVERERTGLGQHVETSLFEAGIGFSMWEATELWYEGSIPRRHGSAHRMSAPYQAVRTAEGYLALAALTERQWRSLAEVLGHPEWVDDKRFSTNAARLSHRAELVALIEAATAKEPAETWAETLNSAGVPAAPVLDYAKALAHPQADARAMTVLAERSGSDPLRMLGSPVKLSRTEAAVRRPPPRLGEHTDEVLRSAGLGEEELSSLRDLGAI